MLIGNKKVQIFLKRLVDKNSESHAYLFFGPRMVGKTTFAHHFANQLICTGVDKPCGKCADCLLMGAGNHPDVRIIDGEESLKVEDTRELIEFFDLKPFQAKKKVLIVTHIERMTASAANSFLKTLEEPAGNTVIILTCENIKKVLSTILSRAQLVRFSLCNTEEIKEFFKEKNVEVTNQEKLIPIIAGRPGLVNRLLEDEKFEEILGGIEEFSQIIESSNLLEKIKFAEKLVKNKEGIAELLFFLENYYHQLLHKKKEDSKVQIAKLLDSLQETKFLLESNVNNQLCLESLLFSWSENK